MPALAGFIGGSYVSQSPLADDESTINFYQETVEAPNAVSPTALYSTPGLTSFASVPSTPVRGLFGQSGRCFAVGGTSLYSVSSTGVVASLGAMTYDNNLATMTTNGDGGDELFICSGGYGYILDLTSLTLTQEVSDVTMGAMLDGYFLALDVDTSTLKISDLLDGLTWDPTQIAQRSTASDPWKSLLVVGKNIWLLGEFTSELWYNTGDTFPFAPFPGALIPMGVAATFSACQVGANVMWLAQNSQGARMVIKAQGITPTKVSTYAIDTLLDGLDSVSDAEAYSYQERGHTFYVLNFPTANRTLVYDDTEGLWHERGDWDTVNNVYDVDRPRVHAYIYDQHLVGDRTNGTIYTMSAATATNADGVGIRRLRRTAGLQAQQRQVYYHCLRVFLEPGLGLSSGQGVDPQITLRYSDDGGKTWSNELSRSAGAQGEYRTLVDWWRLGMARYPRVWEVVVSDPIPWRLMGAWVNPQQAEAG